MAKVATAEAAFQKLIDGLPELIKEESQRLPEILQALVAENWNNSDNPSPYQISQSAKLYKRSGDLTRALVRGRKGNIFKQSVSGSVFSATLGIDKAEIGYRDIHEYGGTFTITAKQRKFFWAMFYSTGADMFRGLALAKTYTVPARPYWNPAIQKLGEGFGLELVKDALLKGLLKLWSKG